MIHAREDYNRIQDPEGKIGADEPVFLLRAKDELAPGILMNYAQELLVRGGQDSVRMVNMVRAHARLMADWQAKNGSHLPDLPPEYCAAWRPEKHSLKSSAYDDLMRDTIAVEAMKVYLSHQGDKVISPLNRLKKWLGMKSWKQVRHYNSEVIAKGAYEMADKMIEVSKK